LERVLFLEYDVKIDYNYTGYSMDCVNVSVIENIRRTSKVFTIRQFCHYNYFILQE